MGLMAGFTILSSIPAFAGQWKQDSTGWWYGTNENNTTWYNSGWQWVDGNNDGIAESYYFNSNGYIAVNATVDGYTVNNDGAWTVNGIVQTKQVTADNTTTQTSQPSSGRKTWNGMTEQEIRDKYFGGGGIGNGSGAQVELHH